MTHGRVEPLQHYIRVDTFDGDDGILFQVSCRLCPWQELTDDRVIAAIWSAAHAERHQRNGGM